LFRAALKSLLGRKVRLLMSTFAIVLSVAFVGGSLIFSDTLGRSFTALFASTVGDVVVRPADGADNLGATTVSMPADVVRTLEEKVPDAARVDGRIVDELRDPDRDSVIAKLAEVSARVASALPAEA
jgi:putative ABC transport system permease protein